MFLALLCGIHQHTNVAGSIHQRGTGNGVHSLFIFCEALSRDFGTSFVKNDKLVSICDADGIKKPETNVQRSVPGRRKR